MTGRRVWGVLSGAAALLLLSAGVEGQQRRPLTTAYAASELSALIGGSQLELEQLNARFAAHGYPVEEEQFLQLGLNWARVSERLVLGAELAGLARPAQATLDNRYRTQVMGGLGMLNVGYDLFRDGGLSVRPKIGVGAGALTLRMSDREAPSFDEILQQPGRSVHLTAGSLLVDASLGLSYRVQPRPTARGSRSTLLGLRAGYTHSLLHGGWMREGTDAPGGPVAGWGGPHVEFSLGRSIRR